MWSLVEIDRTTWNIYWPQIIHANLMQSWEYGEAKQQAQRWRPRRFLIQDESSRPKGLVQALTWTIPMLGGVARINRGPLLFNPCTDREFSISEMFHSLEAIVRLARRQRWWYLSIAPEVQKSDQVEKVINRLGFQRGKGDTWGSALIVLKRDPDEIRNSFHSKWRNLLRKAEKLGLELEICSKSKEMHYLLEQYRQLQRRKDFSGIPNKIIEKMALQDGPHWTIRTLYALHKNDRVGGILVVGHGDTCTYLIGWSSEKGRSLQATYFLLWQAMLIFRSLGYKWFDVGGLSEHTPKGIVHFKRGMKGKEYLLIGEYVLEHKIFSKLIHLRQWG